MESSDNGVAPGNTACPACGSVCNIQIGRPASGFGATAGASVFHQPAYAIRNCVDCGLYFKSHILAPDELADYYAGLEFEAFDCGTEFPTDRLLHRKLKNMPHGSMVLDFGCSTGRILKGLTDRLDCVGVEPNEAAAAVARGRGITVISERQLRAREIRKFDAILLTDVYEHLTRPVDVLEYLTALLAPGGWLAIVTGTADAIRHRDYMAEFWYFRVLGHFQMLGDEHVRWLAARLGLVIEARHRCSHYNTPLKSRLRQYVQSLAYREFHGSRVGRLATFLRFVPLIRRAVHWSCAPALTYGEDHLVVILRKNPACKPI